MWMFSELPFGRMTEADVREELIAPLLRVLGYQSGTSNDIVRELPLRYPRVFLGRKNMRKDPILRGRADYMLEVDGRVRWVLEAKSPGEAISVDDIEQAWTYANHAEVRAVYFAICNGREFVVYKTQEAPAREAVLVVKYEQLGTQLDAVVDLLSPTAINRDFPVTERTGPPLGPGLRSIARIASGIIRYAKSSVDEPVLSQLQALVTGGAIERDEEGRLTAFLQTQAPFRALQEFNERLGFHEFEMVSEQADLSIDSGRATEFVYSRTLKYPEGERLLDLRTWETHTLPVTVTVDVLARARGVLRGNVLEGDFLTVATLTELGLQEVTTEGSFSIQLV
jgi:hypothetical protein